MSKYSNFSIALPVILITVFDEAAGHLVIIEINWKMIAARVNTKSLHPLESPINPTDIWTYHRHA
jgi:hypothetical protein